MIKSDELISPNFALLGGEILLETSKDVTHVCPFDGAISGTLFITNYRLVFENSPTEAKKINYDWKGIKVMYTANENNPGPEVPLGLITRIEKIGGQSNKKEGSYGLEIVCSDFRTLKFALTPENHSRKSIFDLITIHAFPLSYGQQLFAFNFKETFEFDGWSIYKPEEELQRMKLPNKDWRISDINSTYEICKSYPSVLCVPESVDNKTLDNVSKFRSRGRIPILSWIHPETKATITRCSQPKVGPWRRNEHDEEMIKAIRIRCSNPSKLYIMDARPKANAVANQAKGAGYESTEVYQDTEILFLGIHNIHVMRDSLRKMVDSCFPKPDEEKFLSNVDASHWLEHTKLLLSNASKIVEIVDKMGSSVLVHCSDGWDRTSQLTSLSMMMMDPFYRTIKGFALLIEKEWLSFGHKFAQRLGHGDKNYNDEQRSPIFIQFLDCVYQLLYQFPCSFEFNDSFLLCLADEIFTCRFGTFLYNDEQSRLESNLKEKTQSLWSYIFSEKKKFQNPLFIHTSNSLVPSTSMRKLQIWSDYYLRWNPKLKKYHTPSSRNWELRLVVEDLQEKISHLEKQLR